tara:strand:- start:82 stop:762 length:681 start_codon:yes stop_codon:yes gene_type:complete
VKFLKILLIIIFIIIPSISYAKSGKGELKLSKQIMEFVMMYMYGAGSTKFSADKETKNDPLVMAVSTDGRYAWYMYCPAEYRTYGCMDNNTVYRVKKKCEKRSNGVPCFTFAKKRKITWKNGGNKVSIKRSDLKDPYLVAKKIQDAGFYDGDLMDLPGINYKTGQLLEDKNLSGKKEKKQNSLNITKKTNSSNIVEDIKELKKLFDEGVITEKEFTQAKSKILESN